ncbi:hypothetical protein EON65_02130 [archaeon]|nr:MAG: hypothetical protein EON65_02130 [archaeon]
MDSVDKKQAEKTLSAFNIKLQQKIKEAASKFKTSIQLTTKAQRLQKMWGHRMYEAVVDSTGSDEFKSAAVLEFFESELVPLWLYCKHVALVLECFAPIGLAHRSNIGSYRVELVVMVFDRILDLQNFELILMMLNAEEQAALYARIGVLNVFNPSKPEGARSFDLTRWEERQLVKMFVHMSVCEPGDNCKFLALIIYLMLSSYLETSHVFIGLNKQFIFDRGFAPIPGWDLSVTWLSDEGLPKKGLLCFEFYAGAGMQLYGCKVDIRLRQVLSSLVLVGQQDFLSDMHRGDMLNEEVVYPEYRPDSRAAGDAAATTEEGGQTPPPAQVFLFKTAPDYVRQVKPVHALEKLNFQIDAICKINEYSDLALDAFESQSSVHKDSITTWSKQPKMRMYVADDANRHLIDTTDITWNYIDNAQKYETWLVAD